MRIVNCIRATFVCGLTGLALLATGTAQTNSPAMPPGIQQSYGKLPLSFEANQGQADSNAKFAARGPGYSLMLTDSSAVLALNSAPNHADILRMDLLRSNPNATVVGAEQLPGTANYFIGSDPSKWHSNVPTFAKVRYSNIYDGIDLVYYGNQRQLEYDFVVAPGASPRPIRLHFSGDGKLSLTSDGDLNIHAENGQIAFHKPVVYQQIDGHRLSIPGRFTLLAGHEVGFALGKYDHTQPLIIDPVLAYSTFLGGTKGENAIAIAVDSEGNAYVSGTTNCSNFPVTEGAYQAKNISNTQRAFITKLNPTGTALIYSTYLGGSGGDQANSIALDGSGNLYLAGQTGSSDFPVTAGAYLPTSAGGAGFVTKLNATGTGLIYSTYFNVYVLGMAVDSSGNTYLVGATFSSTFPVTPGAFLTTFNPNQHQGQIGFVSKMNPTGTALVYSTFLGGSGAPNDWGDDYPDVGDWPGAVAVDAAGNAYVTGFTFSDDFPVTPGAFQTTDNEAYNTSWTGFVTKLNPTGTALVYSTYLGGSGNLYEGNGEFVNGIALDSAGDAYVGGVTWSPDFPTANAFQSQNYGYSVNIHGYDGGPVGSNGFVTKFNTTGTALVFSTYMGGIPFEFGGDGVGGIAVDAGGNAYVAGYTDSIAQGANPLYGVPALPAFPITPGAFQPANATCYCNGGDPTNGFVSQIGPDGSLLYSTYLGGTTSDAARPIAVDGSGNAYVAGSASSNDFPVTPGAFQTSLKNQNQSSAFIAKLDLNSPPSTIPTITTLNSTVNPQTFGQPVTYTASVVGADGTTQTAGDIVFSLDGAYVTTEPLTGSGTAAFTNSTLVGGPHYIQAIFSGNPTYTVSNTTLTEAISGLPAISPASGKYVGPIQVSIAGAIPAATVRYTLDGSAPTASSPAYGGPFTLTSGYTLVRAAAFVGASPASAIVQASYTSLAVTPTPVISVASGTYPGGIPLLVTITDSNATATIRYTTDGSTPNPKSLWYHEPINVTKSETITAIAVSSEVTSAPVSATYTIATPEPTLSPAPGKYTGSVSVSLGDIDSSATIYYTLNGGNPDSSSPMYNGPITLGPGYTVLRAVAVDPAFPPSPVAEGAYSVTAQNPPPTFSPAAGPYAPGQTVTLSDSITTATIRYTTDGSTPTTKSPIYSKPIPLSGTETIQAIATGTTEANSNVASATYTPQ